MEHHVYWLLKSSCFKLLKDEKYDIFLFEKLMERWYLLGIFEIFHDISGPWKYGFWCSVSSSESKWLPDWCDVVTKVARTEAILKFQKTCFNFTRQGHNMKHCR